MQFIAAPNTDIDKDKTFQYPRVWTFSRNARSVNNKSATITDLIDELRLDVLAIQESWHENSDALS